MQGWGMDKTQTDIPVDKKINNESNVGENNVNNKTATDSSTSDSAIKDEIQLADLLKPSTLIIALATLVLLILFGWYVYVLKPALNENESMIHFMESAYQKKNIVEIATPASKSNPKAKQNAEEKASLPVSSVSQPAAVSVSEASSSPEKSMVAENQMPKNKPAKLKKHKTRKHRQTTEATVVAQRYSKCTQAQIVLQQCS